MARTATRTRAPRTTAAKKSRVNPRLLVPVNTTGTNASLLSRPEKMRITHNGRLVQVYSWGIQPGRTCPGATYGKGHNCDGCYAKKGQYLRPSAKLSMQTRTEWTLECFKSPEGIESFVQTMIWAIRWGTIRRNVFYFRIHHSGDFFSAEYADAWYRICEALPEVKFWAPTTSNTVECNPNAYNRLSIIEPSVKRLASLPNVTVRPSSRLIGYGNILEVDGLAAGTGIVTKAEKKLIESLFGIAAKFCSAPTTDGNCADCQSCWDEPLIEKYYILH